MKTAISALVVALAAAMIAPAFAGPQTTSPSSACERSFATSLGALARDYRIEFLNRGHVDTDSQFAAGEFLYDMAARDARTGLIIASGTCLADEADVVVALSTQQQMDTRMASNTAP
jgi:hypothetical protein